MKTWSFPPQSVEDVFAGYGDFKAIWMKYSQLSKYLSCIMLYAVFMISMMCVVVYIDRVAADSVASVAGV